VATSTDETAPPDRELWSWTLTLPSGEVVRGLAPDPHTAHRTGLFAAGAAEALVRIAERAW
jgi:hypothetical protein